MDLLKRYEMSREKILGAAFVLTVFIFLLALVFSKQVAAIVFFVAVLFANALIRQKGVKKVKNEKTPQESIERRRVKLLMIAVILMVFIFFLILILSKHDRIYASFARLWFLFV